MSEATSKKKSPTKKKAGGDCSSALCSALDDARRDGRRSIIAKLAYRHGGHNASKDSWGRLGMQVDTEDDEAVAEYFHKEISADVRKPLEAEIVQLKARLFDLQNNSSADPMRAVDQPQAGTTDLVRQLSEDNRILRESAQRTHSIMGDCLRLLDAAGLGKPGSPHGNTLLGMVMEACKLLQCSASKADGGVIEMANTKPSEQSGLGFDEDTRKRPACPDGGPLSGTGTRPTS